MAVAAVVVGENVCGGGIAVVVVDDDDHIAQTHIQTITQTRVALLLLLPNTHLIHMNQ